MKSLFVMRTQCLESYSHSPFWLVKLKPGDGFARNYPAPSEFPTKPRASGWVSFGSTAVTTMEAPDVAQALGQIIASNLSFDIWYRERLQELHGINLAGYEQFLQPVPLPQNQEIHFDWKLKPIMSA
jgi:hypothetical protein